MSMACTTVGVADPKTRRRFRHHFCETCLEHGIVVAAERVGQAGSQRVLGKRRAADGPFGADGYMLANQTTGCAGEPLVIHHQACVSAGATPSSFTAPSKSGRVFFCGHTGHGSYESRDILQRDTLAVQDFIRTRTGPVILLFVASQGLVDRDVLRPRFRAKHGSITTTADGDSLIDVARLASNGWSTMGECGLMKTIILFRDLPDISELVM